EDGIRDFHVTGVQTCALPIWTHRADLLRGPGLGLAGQDLDQPGRAALAHGVGRSARDGVQGPPGEGTDLAGVALLGQPSDERDLLVAGGVRHASRAGLAGPGADLGGGRLLDLLGAGTPDL